MKFNVGDEAALFIGGHLSRITTVTAITATGITRVTGSDATFGADGWQRGKPAEKWRSKDRIEPATDAHREALRRRAIIATLEAVQWRTLPTATLERVVAALDGEEVQP